MKKSFRRKLPSRRGRQTQRPILSLNCFVLPPDNKKRLVINQPREGLLGNGAGKAESQNAALAFCANRLDCSPDVPAAKQAVSDWGGGVLAYVGATG